MKIAQFIASLLPSFGKDRITEDCRLTRASIKDVTHPAYAAALPLFKTWKFKSEDIKAKIATYDRMVKKAGHGNIIANIEKAFGPILENLDTAEDMVIKTFGEDIAGSSLTYMKANLLQFIELIGFVSKYARKFLIYVYVCESAEFPESGTTVADSLSKAEIEWLNANFISFCTALSIVSGNPQHVRKSIEDVPEIVVTSENVNTLGATVGEAKLDPFQMKLVPIWMNPIYHIGMVVAEWQAESYKASKEEVRLLELRKMNLIKLAAGQPDARLQKEIAYMESRIQGLNYKLAEMEKKNA